MAAPSSTGWSYVFADLLTKKKIEELPLAQVSGGPVLNGAGSLQAVMPTGTDSRLAKKGWQSALLEGRTIVWMLRGSTLMWGAILWQVRPRAGGGIQLRGSDLLSYYSHRLRTTDYSVTNRDQFSIVEDLVNAAHAVAGGNIGVTVPSTTSGILRTYSLTGDQFQSIDQAIKDLAALDQGFDYGISVGGTPEAPSLRLYLAYPYVGRSRTQSGLVFQLVSGSRGNNIVDYDWPRDGTLLADSVWEIGAGSGKTLLRSNGLSPALLDAGYPLLEATKSRKTVTTQSILDARARADAKFYAQPAFSATLKVRADADPTIGSYGVGDHCRVFIADDNYPVPLDTTARITGVSFVPPEPGQDEHIVLTLGQAAQ